MADPVITLDTSKDHIAVHVDGVLFGTMTGPHPEKGGRSYYEAIKGGPLSGCVIGRVSCPIEALKILKAEIVNEASPLSGGLMLIKAALAGGGSRA